MRFFFYFYSLMGIFYIPLVFAQPDDLGFYSDSVIHDDYERNDQPSVEKKRIHLDISLKALARIIKRPLERLEAETEDNVLNHLCQNEGYQYYESFGKNKNKSYVVCARLSLFLTLPILENNQSCSVSSPVENSESCRQLCQQRSPHSFSYPEEEEYYVFTSTRGLFRVYSPEDECRAICRGEGEKI